MTLLVTNLTGSTVSTFNQPFNSTATETTKTANPKMFKGPQGRQIQQRLKGFCEEYCPGVPFEQAKAKIAAGEKLETLLSNYDITDKEVKEASSPEAAVNLIWLLTAKAAKYDELYTSGAMRLDDGDKVEKFLHLCGQGQVYTRISTHLKENLGKDQSQYGLDLRDMGLPSKKHTLLFAQQPDGSLYLKIEESGCPPFWKKGFRTLKNFREFVGHTIDFLRSRPCFKFFSKKKGMKVTRQEHVSPELKEAFTKAMNTLYPEPKKSFFATSDAQKHIEEGVKYGVSRMQTILNKAPKYTKEQIDAQNELQAVLDPILVKAKNRGYAGNVKGNEVVLPALGR